MPLIAPAYTVRRRRPDGDRLAGQGRVVQGGPAGTDDPVGGEPPPGRTKRWSPATTSAGRPGPAGRRVARWPAAAPATAARAVRGGSGRRHTSSPSPIEYRKAGAAAADLTQDRRAHGGDRHQRADPDLAPASWRTVPGTKVDPPTISAAQFAAAATTSGRRPGRPRSRRSAAPRATAAAWISRTRHRRQAPHSARRRCPGRRCTRRRRSSPVLRGARRPGPRRRGGAVVSTAMTASPVTASNASAAARAPPARAGSE